MPQNTVISPHNQCLGGGGWVGRGGGGVAGAGRQWLSAGA